MRNKERDLELITKMMDKLNKKACESRKIDIVDENEKKVCVCSNDEPYCDGNVEDCKCECDAHGLYFDEENTFNFDIDNTECENVMDENRYNKKFGKYNDASNNIESNKNNNNNNNNNKVNKCFKHENTPNIRHSQMFVSEMKIDFESMDMPCIDEITSANINYDFTSGKQLLHITVRPLGHDTYIDRFLSSAYLGRIYLVNQNDGIKLSKRNILLSDNAKCENLFCGNLIGYNEKNTVDLCTTLEYNVLIEL